VGVHSQSPPCWQVAALTDIGRVRQSNQDAFALLNRPRCWIVADGMGGHAGGGIASRVAVDAIAMSIQAGAGSENEQPVGEHRQLREKILAAAIWKGHQAIRREVERDASLQGMGTTVVVVQIQPVPVPEATLAHVGDSRAYLFRRDVLTPLTRDHSLVEEYRRQGLLTSEEVQIHPLRHVLSRAVGPDPEVEPEVSTVALQPDDQLLLCTDGLTKMLTDREIGRILARSDDVQASCAELVATANRHGGDDNITVVVVRWRS
jgi:serine/threonine protein phosphatase PrpC